MGTLSFTGWLRRLFRGDMRPPEPEIRPDVREALHETANEEMILRALTRRIQGRVDRQSEGHPQQ